ncbi:MAG TPA: spore coat associated protein CotJA [Candidatus Choladousia intestinigallinarum]|nr:spore coat associated protein CotJA [Candidatus Choladousia intestinigallinarum]
MAMANAPLAMGYVPTQAWETPFQPCKGLSLGTIFPSLCYPFCGKGGRCK